MQYAEPEQQQTQTPDAEATRTTKHAFKLAINNTYDKYAISDRKVTRLNHSSSFEPLFEKTLFTPFLIPPKTQPNAPNTYPNPNDQPRTRTV